MKRQRLTTWTNREVRALLVALHGGTMAEEGLWQPNRTRAARARHVSPSTISRWYAGDPDDISPIPVTRLRSLLRGHRPTRDTRRRERLERTRLDRIDRRARLGRGRGNMAEYTARGWNDPHMLIATTAPGSPLARLTVLRADPTGLLKRTAGRLIISHHSYPSRFAADRARLDLLEENDHLRIRVQRHRGKPGWTQEILTTTRGFRLRAGDDWGAPQ